MLVPIASYVVDAGSSAGPSQQLRGNGQLPMGPAVSGMACSAGC